ncbi:hypothetical protein HAZT_HAZT003060 [Hyalella azteca]|uniref:C2H2-type domain-containing protein n=1 Tax=Hyalella azteca TaxID=294128 RepID=A0A6A0H2X4_HYAAZ|nr:hypothetical protein HAZT_HAZT003060 [Hyalella azteca]
MANVQEEPSRLSRGAPRSSTTARTLLYSNLTRDSAIDFWNQKDSIIVFDDSSRPLPRFEELNLEQHVTNEKFYQCPVCRKILTEKYSFRRHYMIHSREKPYACPHCHYRTIQSSDLRVHMSRRHLAKDGSA